MSDVDQAAPELLPCPLCGAEIEIEGDGYEHPASDDCPLDSLYLEARHAAAWNRRADLAAPSAQPRMETAVREAINLLMERTYGSPARSPGHNARRLLEAALTSQQPATSAPAEVEGLVGTLRCTSGISRESSDGWTYLNEAARKLLADAATALTDLKVENERLRAITGQLADALHTADTIIADHADIASESEQQEIDNALAAFALAAYAKLKGEV